METVVWIQNFAQERALINLESKIKNQTFAWCVFCKKPKAATKVTVQESSIS